MRETDCQRPFSAQLKNNPPRKQRNLEVREREYLTETELDALMAAAKKTGRHGFRDYVMILICYHHGLRVGELIDLKWTQIEFERALIHINRLKNGDSSVQPLSGNEMRLLRKLKRENTSSVFVFNSERKGPLTERAFHKIIARAGRLAEMPFPVHPHQLRHTTGYRLAQNGVDTRAIQAYLGHKNIAHTVKYTKLDASRFKQFVRLL